MGFWKWRSIFRPCTESCQRLCETGTLWRLYGLTYLHRPGGLRFLVGEKKSKSLCFWCILKMPSIQHLLIKPHNTNTYTHIPIPPKKKTSSHYISEFFLCATFHACIGSQTSGNRGLETWIFQLHEKIEEWSLAQKLLETFPHLEASAELAGCFFLGNFCLDFCWSRNMQPPWKAVLMYVIYWVVVVS